MAHKSKVKLTKKASKFVKNSDKKKPTFKKTTSKDVPGTGGAKKAATAIEKRRKLLRDI